MVRVEGVCAAVTVPLSVPLALMLGEPVIVGASVNVVDTDAEPHVLPLREGNSVPVGQLDGEVVLRAVPLEEGDALNEPLGEALAEGPTVRVGEGVPDGEVVEEGEPVPE